MSTYALIEHMSISIVEVSAIKLPLLYLGGLCMLPKLGLFFKRLKKKRYFYVIGVLLIFCVLIYISARHGAASSIGSTSVRPAVRLILYLVELFLLMIWLAEVGWGRRFLNFLFHYVLILTLVTDLLLFSRLIVFSNGDFESFLVGTKFTVSYFHMNLLTLWTMRRADQTYSDRRARRVLIIGVPVVALVSIYVDCMTGVLGCLVLVVLFFLFGKTGMKKLVYLNSPVVLLAAMVASVAFPFLAEQIVSVPFVTYVVETVLGRNSSLTGRMNIFGMFGRQMEGNWLWGFGFGNGNAASVELFGYANAQNALLNWILQTGIPATMLFVLLMLTVFHFLSKSKNITRSMPLVILVYVYTILGAVEVTFSMSFILWIAVIYLFVNEDAQPKKTEET
ncbi:MAG: hypothetical protein J6J43_01840 [Oscillospiraceae bacterium]|nr:hypothetical protein [Oscillospiraceae bacterium]